MPKSLLTNVYEVCFHALHCSFGCPNLHVLQKRRGQLDGIGVEFFLSQDQDAAKGRESHIGMKLNKAGIRTGTLQRLVKCEETGRRWSETKARNKYQIEQD